LSEDGIIHGQDGLKIGVDLTTTVKPTMNVKTELSTVAYGGSFKAFKYHKVDAIKVKVTLASLSQEIVDSSTNSLVKAPVKAFIKEPTVNASSYFKEVRPISRFFKKK
jgi:hypothetical protein